ncbi:hypothetical protein ABGY98_001670 [Salmonella enterica]|uniref:Uncharacterized protein n=1 Tax=Salmonella enterica subsp. diarizonae serovar 48:i:z TaxID=1192842 RepID=A0A7U6BE15_SALDZ|nr:hypothetical protein [Salmonella enterica]EAA4450851.1 hypothetical protein [Salmonella enterica subsp. diarizonae]AXC71655.1 hypothetical protein DOE59_08680 [Salmonella enterica subsp. diarizonae serovar 48:i:z]EAM2673160.1 hypothetical protein [Salmonella enterica]EAM6404755.1 hypothetical protein [Salmonella enterica]EAN2410791.1 hypothetical protein [Salmonella enterica]
MSLIQKAQAAVGIMTDLTASLLEQKTKLEAQIAEKNDAIQKLLNMPMNLDDFCSFIPEYVRVRGELFYNRFGYENREKKLIPWGSIEKENGDVKLGNFYISGEDGSYFSDAGIASFSRECFFHPENTVKRLTDKLKSELADSWGNEQYPSIKERRITVASLQAERAKIQEELDEVNANLAGIRSAASNINIPEPDSEE